MTQGFEWPTLAYAPQVQIPTLSDSRGGQKKPTIVDLGEIPGSTPPSVQASANAGLTGDSWTDIKRGVMQLPGAVTGLLDIPFAYAIGARPISEGWDAIGGMTKFQPGKWAKEAEADYTPERKAQMAAVSKAWDDNGGSELSRVLFDPQRWGELPTQWDRTDAAAVFQAIKDNPRATWGQVLQSLPSTVAGGVASGVARMLAKIPASVAAGLGEGAVTAGAAMDQIDPRVDARKAATAALGSGAITGIIGGVSGAVSSKLGIPDIEMPMPKTGKPYPMYARVPVGMVKEGVFEEGLQSPQEQAWQNWAEGKPLGEGTLRAGVEGAIAGAVLGGAYAMRKPRLDNRGADDAIPADDIGAGPGGGSGAIEGTFIPGDPQGIADQRGGPIASRQPETYTQITPTALPRLALPAPEDGGPSARQVATARGLLNHSPKASPELLQRLMRVDQATAAMLFNHWKGNQNDALSATQNTETGFPPRLAEQGAIHVPDTQGIRLPESSSASENAPSSKNYPEAAAPDAVTPLDVQAQRDEDVHPTAKVGSDTTADQPNAALNKLQASYDAAKASGDSFEVQRIAHEINQAKRNKPAPSKAPAAAIDPAAPYGKVGVAPFSSQIVGLQGNSDGTATVMRGDEPFYDFETGDPVTVPTGATAEQIRKAVTESGALSKRDKWFGVAKAETKPAEAGTEPAKTGTEPTKSEKQPADPVAESNASPMERDDDGVAPIQDGAAADTIAGKPVADMAAEQLQKIADGESKTFGKAAVDKAAAELHRRAGEFVKAPDGSIDFGEITSEQASAMRRQGGKIRLERGDDSYGEAHIEKKHGDDIRAAGFSSVAEFVADIAKHIDQIWLPESTAQLVAIHQVSNDRVMFIELRPKRDKSGDYYSVRSAFPARRDYVKNKHWKMLWEGRAQPSADSGSSAPFAVPLPNHSGEAATIPSGSNLTIAEPLEKDNATKEPWQYGELEYGDKYIDEVVLPQLSKELENAHGGRFQEYKSKAAAVRGLKERIDALENHRDAKARKYYASLDNHYGAVRAALADGKPVPPVAYESYEDLKGDVSAGRIKGDGQEVARVEQPQHIEAGQAEPATAPVIAASIKESAKNTPMNIEQAREWLLSEIDKAIIDAKSAKEEGIWNRADDKVNLEGIMDVGATIGFKTFNVPGDGKFRVLNLKESLQKFKKQVAATPGFKKNATRPMSLARDNGGKTSVRDMLEDGEYVLAADYGHLTGKPLLFGSVREGEAHPIAYTDAEPVDIKGIDAQVGREWNQTGKSFSWRVIETTTGAMISSESTKEKAISKALAHVDEHGTDKLIAQIKETPKVSQAELERQFTDWGSEEEAKAQKTRDAVERVDTEDRALWNSIWPLSDGEKRSPNPWNGIDHMQVVILAKDAAKAGKGDEFVSLIERRRGGTNNMLALAARKALAESNKLGKQSGGVDYKGFERTPTGNGSFTLKDGNLLVKVEAMGNGKFQASHLSAKSSPHIMGEQGAVEWAANIRDTGKSKTTGYPFYSNNKLYNAEGTAELPKNWTGVAMSDSGKRFFYLSWENGERAYNPLQAKTYDEAVKEAAEKFRATTSSESPVLSNKVSMQKVDLVKQAYAVASPIFGNDIYSTGIQNDWQKLLDAMDGKDVGALSAIEAKYRRDGELDGMGSGTAGAGPAKVNQARRGAAQLWRFARTAIDSMKKAGASDTATDKEAATVGNTEDSGAELTYNRRNRITRGLKWDDIANKNVALRVKEVTKAKVFPKPDYQALVDDGTNPLVAHLVKQVYDAIATVPSMGRRQVATDADMKLYIEAVNRVMDGVQSWATDRAAVVKWSMRQANGAAAAMGKPTSLSDLESVQTLLDTVYPGGWKNYRQEVILLGGNKLLGALQPGYDEVQRATKDIAKGWPGKRESWQQQGYRVLQADDEVVRVKPTNVDGGYFIEVAGKYQTRFPDKASADQGASDLDPWLLLDKRGQIVSGHPSEAAATEAARAVVERKNKAGEIHEKGRAVADAERAGPARRMEGEDIGSDRLKDDFGFRGINFGEWMKGDSPSKVSERQLHLNHAYDAFLDLAEILDVPPKAMSLNGMLGLAIGAQGGGKALAHFVPGVNEINLTRTGGAGALAHEWGHALDHYFGTLAGLEREKRPYLTEHASVTRREAVVVDGRTKLQEVALKPELRPEILDRFKAIVAAMTKRAETAAEAKQRLEANAKRYADHVEGWLRHIRKEFSSATKPGTSDMDAIRAGALMTFDNLAARIGNLDLGEGMVAISRDSAIVPVVAEMRDAFKAAFGRFPDVDSIKALQANIDGLRAVRDRLKADIEHEPQQVATDYQKTSNAADEGKKKPYWSSKLEMFARAFDAFVVDTLAENAAKNSYLAGIEAVPPLGGERKAINTAFRELVATIKTKETDRGVALESRSARAGSGGAGTESTRIIQSIVDKFLKQFAGAAALDIRVVRTVADIPARFRPSPFAEGVFHDDVGLIYLIAMNLKHANGQINAGRVWQVLLHEAVGHAGLARMMGARFKGILKEVMRAARAKGTVAEDIYEPGHPDYATVEAVKLRYPKASDEELAQEVLARMAETDPGRTLFGYVRAVVRQWLRDMARAAGITLDVTTAELNDLVAQASWYMRRGDGVAQGVDVDALGVADMAVGGMASKATGMESRAAPTNPQGLIWSGPEASRADDLIYTMQDKNVDLKRVQQGITKALGDIRDDVDAYLQEELFHGRAAKATEEFLERELQPFIGEMKQRGIDMDTLETFLWARHAKERNAQIAKINPDMPDGGSGLTDAQAAGVLSGKDVIVGGQTVKGIQQDKRRSLEALAAKVDRMVAGNRILTETYELETPDTVAAWKGAYQHYVPLHREDADSPWAGNGTGQGYSVKGSSTKRATGSFRPVENILANIVLQRTRTITRGEKNRVAQALYGLAKESPNEGFWDTDNAPTIRTVENKAIYHVMDGKTEVANFTRMAEAEKLVRKNPGYFMYQDWGDRVVEKIDPTFRSKPNVVWARFGGEDRFVIFNERDERAMRLAGSLKNLDADDISHLLGEVSRWTRYFASINTQYNPVFGVINLIRDTGTGLLNLKSTPLEGRQKELLGNVWQALPAIYKAVRIDRQGGTPTGAWADLWEDFQEAGGKTGYRDMFKNSHEQHEALQMALDPTWWQGKWWGKTLTLGGILSVPEQLLADKIGKPVFEWLSDYNTAMENGIRLSAYKLALDEGMSKERAASLAKNLTVNFNKKGQVARQAGALYAFFNASVQGTARMAETLHHGAKPGEMLGAAGKQIVYGGMLLGAMQAMLLMMAGFDDDEPPEFVRDRNIIIPAGGGKYLMVPLPLGFHVLPAIGRIGTEFVLGGFKKPGKHVAHVFDVLADSFNPIGNAGLSMQTLAPTVLDPVAALAENKDWTGKPIFRENMSGIDQKPGHARTKDTATGLSKGLAYLINAASGGTEFKPGLLSPTPDQIDYLIGQITGGVGRETSKAFQTGSAAITGEDLPTYKIPLVGRFYGDTKEQAAVSGRFYENLKEMNEHQAEIMGLAKSNRGQQAREYMKDNPGAEMFREGDRLQRYISRLRDQKRTMLAGDEPREKIKAIDDQITKTMQDFNQRVDLKKNPQRGMNRVEVAN